MTLPRRRKLAQEIADYLSEEIIHMRIRPGERITEADVAEKFDVSHGPVREAFHLLEKVNLVELVPRRGARVTELSQEGIRCLFEIMIELICLIARLCCKNATSEELARLSELEETARSRARQGDVLGYFSSGYGYALLVLETTRNYLLSHMLLEWLPSIRRAYYLSVSRSAYNLKESVAALKKINEHIKECEIKDAQLSIRAHMSTERERILEIARQAFSPEPGEGLARNPVPGLSPSPG